MKYAWLFLFMVGCIPITKVEDDSYMARSSRTLIVRPSGPGALTQWTINTNFFPPPPTPATNWEAVSGSSTGVRAPGVFTEQIFHDLYGVAFSPPVGVIESVVYVLTAIRVNGTSVPLDLMVGSIRIGTLVSHVNSTLTARVALPTNPVTGLAWQWADFSTLQIGQNQDMNFINEDVTVSDVHLEVTYVPGHQFASGAPVAGIGFNFFCDADAQIKAFLQGTFAYPDLQSLSSFLASKNVTIRPCQFWNDLTHESPSNFPLIYISSFLTDTLDPEPRTLAVRTQTDIRIWSSRPNPQEAMDECNAIAGACLSMLRQSDYDRDAFLWTGHYYNLPQDAGNSAILSPPVVEPAPDGSSTGRVRADLTLNWIHAEDI